MTTWKKKTWPIKYITIITGEFTDNLDYVITDWVGNAIFVNDYDGFALEGTRWSKKAKPSNDITSLQTSLWIDLQTNLWLDILFNTWVQWATRRTKKV